MNKLGAIIEKKAALYQGYFYPLFYGAVFERVNEVPKVGLNFSTFFVFGILVSYTVLWFLTRPWFGQSRDIKNLSIETKESRKLFLRAAFRAIFPLMTGFFVIAALGVSLDVKLPNINWWIVFFALTFQFRISWTGVAKFLHNAPNKVGQLVTSGLGFTFRSISCIGLAIADKSRTFFVNASLYVFWCVTQFQ